MRERNLGIVVYTGTKHLGFHDALHLSYVVRHCNANFGRMMMLFIALPCSLEFIEIPFSSQSIPIFSCPLVDFVAKKVFNSHPPNPHHPTPNAQPTPPTQGSCTAPNHPPTAAVRFHAPPAQPPAHACAPWPYRSPCTHYAAALHNPGSGAGGSGVPGPSRRPALRGPSTLRGYRPGRGPGSHRRCRYAHRQTTPASDQSPPWGSIVLARNPGASRLWPPHGGRG